MGDPAGIGPEIIAQVFRRQPHWSSRCVVVGDVRVLREAAALTGGRLPLAVLQDWSDVAQVPSGALPVLPIPGDRPPIQRGAVSAAAGLMGADSIRLAAQAALSGQVSAIVTAPINKAAFQAAGVDHPGHTEFFQSLAADHLGKSVDELPVRMMLSNHELNTVLVSIHVSLRQAMELITLPRLLETCRMTHHHFTVRRGQPRCRIAVAGLNPHAGEGGLFGTEEIEVIEPTIRAARQEGMEVSGPWPPDTVFMQARLGAYDAVVAMYHDQGLIPVKYMGLAHGVNTTLGLPFLRTSPDHGTAFDLAGTGRADPASLEAAIQVALAGLPP
jgi:4-hydroxythreonine-4-phosphate dehydrogenase